MRREILRHLWLVGSLALAATSAFAQVQPVRIGVLTDMSSVYSDASGQGSLEAAKMAAEDAGPILGYPAEIVFADHQMKADVGASTARRWFEREGVDTIVDVPNSSVAFALRSLSLEKQKILLLTGALSADLTGAQCSPYLTQWAIDTYTQGKVIGSAVVKQGGDSWFFIGANYTFGQALVRDTSAVVEAAGAKVLGSVYAPLGASDFSSFLLQAQASKAKIIGLANSAGDTTNTIKQAQEFGIMSGGQRLAALTLFDLDVKALGLKLAQGLQLPSPFYWDLDDDTRAWSRRYMQKMNRIPTWDQATVYTAVLHYLKAVKTAGTRDSDRVMEAMRAAPISDAVTKNAKLRIDGRVERDQYLLEAKSPSESKGEWDILKVVAKIPAAEATRSLEAGGCPMVKGEQPKP
jgi:branched-chain amino acid transport system substrate-binding protein